MGRGGLKRHIKMRPASRNGRVRVNARMTRVAGPADERPTRNRTSKEEWVIHLVNRVVGSKAGPGFLMADDVASDILLKLLDAGGFNWDEEKIEEFCRRKASYMVLAYVGRRERNESEFVTFGEDDFSFIEWKGGYYPAPQENIVDAHIAERLVAAIPKRQREALEILCDGGNPVNVAEELGITPWEAIALIKEGREYVDRVDPVAW